jgi:hypothetical protein
MKKWQYADRAATLGISWGDDDQRAIDGASDSGDIKVVPFHCAHFDTLFVEPIPKE